MGADGILNSVYRLSGYKKMYEMYWTGLQYSAASG